MVTVTLRTVPPPPEGTRAVLINKGGPYFTGQGDHNYVCGTCGALLAAGLFPGQIADVVVVCTACGAYADFGATRPPASFFTS